MSLKENDTFIEEMRDMAEEYLEVGDCQGAITIMKFAKNNGFPFDDLRPKLDLCLSKLLSKTPTGSS